MARNYSDNQLGLQSPVISGHHFKAQISRPIPGPEKSDSSTHQIKHKVALNYQKYLFDHIHDFDSLLEAE